VAVGATGDGATVVTVPQAARSMLARITRLKTVDNLVFILLSSKKEI
jgi:hypothetical protein